MPHFSKIIVFPLILAIAGCVSVPNSPSVMVLPGAGMSFNQFRNDDAVCEQYASFEVGGATSSQVAINSGVTGAAVGAALGAAAGAALGGGRGAAIGAGTGLLAGSLVGGSSGSSSANNVQERYDMAYIQCMYAKGHQVPVSGQFSNVTPNTVAPNNASPSASPVPPPPPGTPPPPPPGSSATEYPK
jgi:hypothetical protein